MRKHLNEECAQWRYVRLRSIPRLHDAHADLKSHRCRVVAGCKTRSTLANLAAHEQGCSDAAEQILLERTAPGREEGVNQVVAELLTALDEFNLNSVVEDFPALGATITPAQRAVVLRGRISRLLNRAVDGRKKNSASASRTRSGTSGPSSGAPAPVTVRTSTGGCWRLIHNAD